MPGLFAATNAAAGAGRDAAAIELPLHGARLRAVGDLRVAIDGTSQGLIDGQMLDVRPSQFAVRYVSVEGGVDVPFALGGRGALLCVALGPAMLRAGDVLKAGEPVPATDAPWRWPDPDAPIRIIPGPDVLDEEALEVFLCAEFVVGTAMDRTGSRLDGLRIPGCANDLPRSAPMVRGAVQVTRDGVAIVLGPDHPTTGGYPVIAVVAREDQGALALRRPGSSVRFTVAGRHAAQRAG